MKQFIGILLAVILMPASSSFAFVGGPFSGDSFSQNEADGVYEAIATMSNGMGVYRFAVRNKTVGAESAQPALPPLTNNSNVNFGNGTPTGFNHTWYYKGIVYGGACYGTASIALGVITCTGNAQTNTGLTQVTIVDGAPVTTGGNLFTVGPVGGNIQIANSSWMAKIDDEYPVLRFSGTGVVSFLGGVDTETDTVTTTNQNGIATNVETLVESSNATESSADDNPSTFQVVNTTNPITGVTTSEVVEIPSSGSRQLDSTSDSTTVEDLSISTSNDDVSDVNVKTSTGGEDDAFTQVGHKRNFLLFGSRVSLQVF